MNRSGRIEETNGTDSKEAAMNSRPGFTKAIFSRALALCFLLFCSLSAVAQIDRGAIVGRVTDASGAIVPKATVVVTNKDTGVAITTSTNESGEYQVLALIPGTYSVRVSSQGFDSVLRDNLALHVQDRLLVEVSLKV